MVFEKNKSDHIGPGSKADNYYTEEYYIVLGKLMKDLAFDAFGMSGLFSPEEILTSFSEGIGCLRAYQSIVGSLKIEINKIEINSDSEKTNGA